MRTQLRPHLTHRKPSLSLRELAHGRNEASGRPGCVEGLPLEAQKAANVPAASQRAAQSALRSVALRRPPFYQVGIGVGEAAANLAAALARNDFSGRWLIERGIHCCRELAAITVSFAHLLVFLIVGILRGFQRFIEHALVFIYPGALFKLKETPFGGQTLPTLWTFRNQSTRYASFILMALLEKRIDFWSHSTKVLNPFSILY